MPLNSPKKIRIRLSSVQDCARTVTDVLYHDDGRVFLTEKVWKRIHHPDTRIADATKRDIRGSIDLAPITFEGVAIRYPSGHVEVAFRREGCLAVYYEGMRPVSTATWELGCSMRRQADMLVVGHIGELLEPPMDEPTGYICPQCGNTGRIDIGACREPRCIDERSNTTASMAAAGVLS